MSKNDPKSAWDETFSRYDESLASVLLERQNQEAHWGEQNHDPYRYTTILLEEIGEMAQAILHTEFGGRHGGLAHLRKEAVQTAAVALAIVQCLDRGKWRWPGHGALREIDRLRNELAREITKSEKLGAENKELRGVVEQLRKERQG